MQLTIPGQTPVTPTPAAPPQAAAVQPSAATVAASTTTIKLGDKEIELRGITPQQVLETHKVYEALPQEYQKRADAYTKIGQNFERLLQVDLPQGVTLGQAWKTYADAIKNGQDVTKQGVAPYLKQIHAFVKENNIPVIGGMLAADNAADKAGRAVDGAGAVVSDVFAAPGRIVDFLNLMAKEATGAGKSALGLGLSAEKAKAFGAVFAAAEFHESAVRQGLPLIDWSTNNVVFKYPGEALGAAKDHAVSTDAWMWIKSAFKFVVNLLSSYFGEDQKKYEGVDFMQRVSKVWDQSKAEALAEQAATKPELSYGDRVEAKVKAGETTRAADKLKRADVERSLGTPEGVTDAAAGKPHIKTDGVLSQAEKPADGTPPVAQDVKGADGKTVGRADRVAEGLKGLAHDTAAYWNRGAYEKAGIVGMGAATTVGVVKVAPVAAAGVATVARGAAAFTTGAAAGVVAAPAGLAATGTGWKAEQKAEQALAKLNAEKEALEKSLKAAQTASDELKAAEAKGIKAWRERSKAASKVAELQADLSKTNDALNGHKRWFRSDAKGAIKLAEEAHATTAAHMADAGKFARMGVADSIMEAAAKTQQVVGEKLSWAMSKVGIHSVDLAQAAPKAMAAGKVIGKPLAFVGPAIAGYELKTGIEENNGRQITTATTELVTMGSGVAIGGAMGAWGFTLGPVGFATTAAGMAVGGLVGGLSSLVTGWGAGKIYDSVASPSSAPQVQAKSASQPSGALGTPDKGLAAAALAVEEANKVRLAQVARDSSDAVRDARMAAGVVFGQVASVLNGSGNVAPTRNLPQASAAQLSMSPQS